MKTFKTNRLYLIAWLLCSCAMYFMVASCNSEPPENSFAAQSTRGKVHFVKYCSSCHGEDGTGVVIDSLAKQPADLTYINKRYRTKKFPILQVANMIDGRKMSEAHGNREMPVWGEVFSKQEHLDEAAIKGKLGEIIAYLMTIQEQ